MAKFPFKFVARQGQAGVVEVMRDGNTERVLLPMDVIVAASGFTGAQIDAGIPYGLQFGEFLKLPHVETALHNSGVWTLQDLYTKAQAAVGALSASSSLKLSDIIMAAEAYEKQDHTVIKAAEVAPKISKRSKKS